MAQRQVISNINKTFPLINQKITIIIIEQEQERAKVKEDKKKYRVCKAD